MKCQSGQRLFSRDMRALISLIGILATLPLSAASIDVRVTDAKGSPVKDAVVYAIPETRIPVGHKVATMDQLNRTFVPHVLPIQTGTWVEFPNSDDVRHQVYSTSPVKRFSLPLYVGKPSFPVQFTASGIVPIGCNIHEEMSAFIVVVDTPFFARADGGRAVIDAVQAGKYTLHVWYPGMRAEPAPQPLVVDGAASAKAAFVTN